MSRTSPAAVATGTVPRVAAHDDDGFAVVADGLVKRFGTAAALDGVDLRIPYGTVTGLLGPNGSGKTTTVRILSTVLEPDAGRAVVAGADVCADPGTVRRRIGMAGQYAAVDPILTGWENLVLVGRLTALSRRAARARADELLALFRLEDIAGRRSGTYSGGQRRRFDLAAALVHRPRVLFLDEPTTGLDPRSRHDLWAMLRELVAEGTTILLTTQYLEEADQLADRIVVLDRGRVIAQGTPAQLKAGLGESVVALRFGDDLVARRAADTLAGRHRALCRGDRVDVTVDGPETTTVAVLAALHAQGLSPVQLAVREPSLDDVFLALTGRPTADPADPVPAPAGTDAAAGDRR